MFFFHGNFSRVEFWREKLRHDTHECDLSWLLYSTMANYTKRQEVRHDQYTYGATVVWRIHKRHDIEKEGSLQESLKTTVITH